MNATFRLAVILGIAALIKPYTVQAAYEGSAPLLVVNGGTGATTLAAHGPLIGEGTGAIVAITPVAGSLLYQSSASSDPVMSITPVLGVAGTSTGTLGFAGITSGTVTIQPQSAAGTYNFNLPITAGSTGQLLVSAGGGGTAMTFDNISAHLTAGTGISLSGTTNVTINDTSVPPTTTTFTGSLPTTLGSTNLLTTISSMATPAAGTYSLPSVVANLRACLKDGTTNFNTNNATVKPTPTSLTVDGVAGTTGYVLNQAHQETCFISDGTNWFIE